jgi:hypothetical protein
VDWVASSEKWPVWADDKLILLFVIDSGFKLGSRIETKSHESLIKQFSDGSSCSKRMLSIGFCKICSILVLIGNSIATLDSLTNMDILLRISKKSVYQRISLNGSSGFCPITRNHQKWNA